MWREVEYMAELNPIVIPVEVEIVVRRIEE